MQSSKSRKLTHSLIFHAGKYDAEHLCEGGLGRRLVDEVLTSKVNVVAGANGQQHGSLVNFTGA